MNVTDRVPFNYMVNKCNELKWVDNEHLSTVASKGGRVFVVWIVPRVGILHKWYMRNVYHIKNMFTISDTQLQNKHINSQPIDLSILSCLSQVLNSARLLQERYFLMKNRSCDSAFGQLFDISGQCIPPHARARPLAVSLEPLSPLRTGTASLPPDVTPITPVLKGRAPISLITGH